ncbi:myotubularin-related protein 3-like isoform X1 [Branchiostoma lanceolatum]|uniref:myotubularin-related protein 3-like isoform X1 n=1 Tax=Branchiostoma lanceolatum TaxID=7740 RepID=UPI00345326EF
MMADEEQMSLVHVQASELFPKKSLNSEDGSLQVPFPELSGESVEYLGRTSDGIIAISNFRLLLRFKDSFVNVPLMLIESVEIRDLFQLYVCCKDVRSFRCSFPTNEQCQEWHKRLSAAITVPDKLEDLFTFAFHAWCRDATGYQGDPDYPVPSHMCHPSDRVLDYFLHEVERMGFNVKEGGAWRVTSINKDYKFCSGYPEKHVVPASVTNEDLEKVGNFRSHKRIPSVVWRHRGNGAVIARCSQPEVGWLGWRNSSDEQFLQAIAEACSEDCGNTDTDSDILVNGHSDVPNGSQEEKRTEPHKVLIMDARSYAAAVANRAKGGGCECPEYYPNCEVQFMGLANIHSIRKSFQAVRALCSQPSDQANWLSALESTKWLQYLSQLMKSVLMVVNAVDLENRPVVVHCTDGWDRTPQLVALAELLLDPYYRTIEGFQVLVEREWLDFGHKFADRCGHGCGADDINERCPVFLQWLDCVHQLLRQFPCSFEFNEAFLVKLVHHTYSTLYGTFLCNSPAERARNAVRDRTCSVWSLLKSDRQAFRNYLYSPSADQVMRPVCHVRNLLLWTTVYLSNQSPTTPTEEQPYTNPLSQEPPLLSGRVQKTRSCDDIQAAISESMENGGGLMRTSSDTNLTDWRPDKLIPHDADTSVSHATTTEYNSELTDSEINGIMDESNTSAHGVSIHEDTVAFHKKEKHPPDEIETPPGSPEGEKSEAFSNGIHSEECPEEANVDSSVTTNEDLSQKDRMESSTETITAENVECKDRPASPPSTHCNGVGGYEDTETMCNGHGNSAATENGVEEEIPALKLEHSSSVSTSTSDISNSFVNESHERKKPGINGVCPLAIKSHVRRGAENSRLSSSTIAAPSKPSNPINGSVCMHTCSKCLHLASKSAIFYPNGGHAQHKDMTRSLQPATTAADQSCKPPTPLSPGGAVPNGLGERGKAEGIPEESAVSPNMNTLSRHLDVDGLTTIRDVVQQRLHQIDVGHKGEVEALRRQLQTAMKVIHQYQKGGPCLSSGLNGEGCDEELSLPDSERSEEQPSLSNCSTEMSDVSWEQVEERDASVTLWVPDHAVNRCMGCNLEFWMARRKHHCRNCGHVFCDICSEKKISIPTEQLFDPVRVCLPCYDKLIETTSEQVYEISLEEEEEEDTKTLSDFRTEQPIAASAASN